MVSVAIINPQATRPLRFPICIQVRIEFSPQCSVRRKQGERYRPIHYAHCLLQFRLGSKLYRKSERVVYKSVFFKKTSSKNSPVSMLRESRFLVPDLSSSPWVRRSRACPKIEGRTNLDPTNFITTPQPIAFQATPSSSMSDNFAQHVKQQADIVRIIGD